MRNMKLTKIMKRRSVLSTVLFACGNRHWIGLGNQDRTLVSWIAENVNCMTPEKTFQSAIEFVEKYAGNSLSKLSDLPTSELMQRLETTESQALKEWDTTSIELDKIKHA